jgi:antitoxin CcdA
MTLTKRKISISLDEDLVGQLEAGSESLSAQINAAVRGELEKRHRRRLLGELLDELDDRHGPVDEGLIGKYERLLG